MSPAIDQQVETFQHQFKRLKDEVSKVIVGYGGSSTASYEPPATATLLEGVPTWENEACFHFSTSCTQQSSSPDLMPADITGTNVVQESTHGEKTLQFQPGPIFANIVLAEVNRPLRKRSRRCWKRWKKRR